MNAEESRRIRISGDRLGAAHPRYALTPLKFPSTEQFLNTIASDRSDDPELSKMGADRIDHLGLLTHAEMTRAMKYHAALLLRVLGIDEPHVGSRDRFANSLSVSCIVLLTLDVWLHVSRPHQSHGMAKCDNAHASMSTRHGGSSGRTPGQSGASTGGG
jgi:hypothetical protein